jgi:prevent-host-death family protein
MKIARVSELKAALSRYLGRVKQGEEVLVTERGRPVARLVPVGEADLPDAERLRGLEKEGLVRPGGTVPTGFWDAPRPKDPDAAAREALRREREAGP